MRCAQAERRFSEALWNELKHFFRGGRYGGNHHDAEGCSACRRGEMLERQDECGVSKHSDDYRRNSAQYVGAKTHETADSRSAKLREVHPAQESDGNSNDARDSDEDQRPNNRILDAPARLAWRIGELGE